MVLPVIEIILSQVSNRYLHYYCRWVGRRDHITDAGLQAVPIGAGGREA